MVRASGGRRCQFYPQALSPSDSGLCLQSPTPAPAGALASKQLPMSGATMISRTHRGLRVSFDRGRWVTVTFSWQVVTPLMKVPWPPA
eukprot:g5369.t1